MIKLTKNNLISPLLEKMRQEASENVNEFWGKWANELYWFKKWNKVFEWNYPKFQWFINGKTNISYNCLERNIFLKNRGDHTAIIWESPETNQNNIITYNEMLNQVKRVASALTALGIKKGDRITIYMPMVPEAIISMLAITRIGAIHSVVFAGFGSDALADRINDAGSKILITADFGYRKGKKIKLKEIVDKALVNVKCIKKVIIFDRENKDFEIKRNRDILWEEALDIGKSVETKSLEMNSEELAFILHTSGTTAKPKGTVQPHGSYQTYVYTMGKWVYDLNDKDIWWSPADIGWIVGHSYVVYSPLLHGCATIIYEGVPDYPDPGVWWEILERNNVTKFFVAPTGIRALMKYGEKWPKSYNLDSLKMIFSAGEVLNPPAWSWLQKKVFNDKIPVIDHMWQTESSGPVIANPAGLSLLPIKPGSATISLPGIEAEVVDSRGQKVKTGDKGIVVFKKPFPGLTPTLWNDDERYVNDYWNKIPNYYYTGDAAFQDSDGYFWFVGRSDEVIKISAHRIGTVEIENILLTHHSVAESAVVGVPDELRGQVASALVVLKKDFKESENLKLELKKLIRNSLGAIVVISNISFVKMIPKTRSGKIMRRLVSAVLSKSDLGDYSTIEDEASLEEIKKAVINLEKNLKL